MQIAMYSYSCSKSLSNEQGPKRRAKLVNLASLIRRNTCKIFFYRVSEHLDDKSAWD